MKVSKKSLSRLSWRKILNKLTGIMRFYLIRIPKYLLLKGFLIFKQFEVKDAIIIFSETRSGSTWLMEMISETNLIIPNWEPLHPKYGVVPKDYKFGDRPKLEKDTSDNDIKLFFLKILTLKQISVWTTSFMGFSNLINAKYVLTKFVRANGMLIWMLDAFRLSRQPILLLRHPVPTVISQIKAFQSNDIKNREVTLSSINNKRHKKEQDYINSLDTYLEKRIALWCVNNKDIMNLEHIQEKIIIVFYEEILLNPKKQILKISKLLNIPINVGEICFERSSVSTGLGRETINSKKQLSKWINKLNEYEKEKIQLIFDHFGLNTYNAFSPLPTRGAVELSNLF
ncbi:MAG: sulfotransferase domain-containing protein [Cyclobacteriaceae bacterium]|nr:sulfotransferase domain-containing protein [Cyclobacteriaceae bacterium]